MGKVELAAQPEMENILASIKKAIHEETGAALRGTITEGESAGTVFGGSMREMRVRVGGDMSGDPGEQSDLRSKITTSLSQHDPAERYAAPASSRPAPSVRPGFAGILSGAARPPEPQHMRRIADPIRENALSPHQRGSTGSLSEHDYTNAASNRYAQPADWDRQPHQQQAHPEYGLPAETQPLREQPPALPEPMMSGDTSAAASAAFGRLGETLLSRALNDRPIEDLTRELLRTMIKQWLDDNLPDMVERLVREEIARVARRGGR